MTVRRYDSIRAAEAVIRDVEGRGTASQSYAVLRAVERSFWRCAWARLNPLALIRAFVHPPFRVYAVLEGARPLLVVPLERSGGGWRFVCGEYVELDYTDAIYGSDSENRSGELFAVAVERMRADGLRRITAKYLSASSVTNGVFHGDAVSVDAEFENFAIELKDASYESYLASLNSVARHNLLKDRRRAEKSGIGFEFCSSCGYGRPISPGTLSECRRIYRRRQAERYGHRGLVAALYFAVMNYISLSVPGDRGFLAVLRIGGRIAASMEGYVNSFRHALEVPRISMNPEFAGYGPGRMLVAECVRWMLSDTDLRILDLCRGDERYKKETGGTGYLTRTVSVELGRTA